MIKSSWSILNLPCACIPTYIPRIYAAFDFDINQDWLTLPLDPILNIPGADVTNTMYGPEIGGQDMLEMLLNQPDPYGRNNGFQ